MAIASCNKLSLKKGSLPDTPLNCNVTVTRNQSAIVYSARMCYINCMKKHSSSKYIILAIALIPWLTPAGSPIITTLSEMARKLDLPESTAKLVFTMPNLTMIVTCLVGGAVVGNKISYRVQITASTVVMAISGTVVFFINDFVFLLIMRGLFGLAMGFITPVSSSLIFRLFSEDKRARIVGISTASMYMGNIAYTFIGGLFGARGWQYVYLIHIFCILPMALALWLLPDVPANRGDIENGDVGSVIAGSDDIRRDDIKRGDKDQKTIASAHDESAKGGFWERFPPICIFFVLFNFIFMLLTFPMQINVSFILSELEIESSTTAGFVLIMNTVAGALAGVIFGYVTRALRRYSLLLALLICAAGMLLASLAEALTLLLIGSALTGAGMAMINIAILLEVSYYVKKAHIGFYSGINMAALSVGAFCVSAYTGLLSKLGFTSSRSPLMVSAVCVAPLLIMFMIFIINTNGSRRRTEATDS